MSFTALSLLSLLTGFAAGFIKFFTLGILSSHYGVEQKVWIIQLVNAILTVGPVLVYAISGPLSGAFKKSRVMSVSAFLCAVVAGLSLLSPSIFIQWTQLIALGLLLGLVSAAKMASVPLEAKQGRFSSFAINGVLSALYILGLLSGVAGGAWGYDHAFSSAKWVVPAIFVLVSLLSLFCRYEKEHLYSFRHAKSSLVIQSVEVGVRYWLYLCSSPLLWGIAGAYTLAITALAQTLNLGDSTQCSLMLLYAALGTVAGNALAPSLKKIRYELALLSALAMSLFILFLAPFAQYLLAQPIATSSVYALLSLGLGVMGLLFGLVSNFIDSEYLELVEKEGHEGVGAALQSAGIAFFSFSLGGFIGISLLYGMLSSLSQFVLLGLLSLFASFLLYILGLQKGRFVRVSALGLVIFTRLVLKFRYSIKTKGLENLGELRGGILFLPNHPAEIDPVIIGSLLWPRFAIRPVVDEHFYNQTGIHGVMELIKAYSLPNTSGSAGKHKVARIKESFSRMQKDLEHGANLLLYPAGKLKRTAHEDLGAASGAYDLVKSIEQVHVVLARTRGLWGSSFSTARTGGPTPSFAKALIRGLKLMLKAGLFFMPRRKVEIEFKLATPAELFLNSRKDFNRGLESFYNEHGSEPLALLPEHPFNSTLPEADLPKISTSFDTANVDAAVTKKVLQKLAQLSGLPVEKIEQNYALADELGLDSLDASEILVFLQEDFDVEDLDLADLVCVGHVIEAADTGGVGSKNTTASHERTLPALWLKEKNRPSVIAPEGQTLVQAFLHNVHRMKKCVAVADDGMGGLSYTRFLTVALALGRVFKKEPDKRLGILLPAGVAANLAIFGALLAGKVPVIINWTLGQANLDHIAHVSGIRRVFSSSAFLERLDNLQLGELEKGVFSFEELKQKELDLAALVSAALEAHKKPADLLRYLKLDQQKAEDEAVILFTSGSESQPKGVPLSHANLLAVLKGAVDAVDLKLSDILYGFLPPFHSFGLSVTTLLPLLTGLKAVYHPNPTEYRKLARGCAFWGVSIVCSTPSFLTGIIKSSRNDELKSLRIALCGAEKTPDELFVQLQKSAPDCQLLEGYGITECAPVISLNRLGEKRSGVGRPFKDVEILIVHPESHSPLPTGERGLILIKGPNVFYGYLGKNTPNPFLTIQNKRYYNTGDLGRLNEEHGSLFLEGRLKRFVKIAGEMLSLPALEEALGKKWPPSEDGAIIAILALEKEGEKAQLLLFYTFSPDSADSAKEQANQHLKDSGFGNICRISKAIYLKSLPMLGTGKLDYQSLARMTKEQQS